MPNSERFESPSYTSADEIIKTLGEWVQAFGMDPAIEMGYLALSEGLKGPDSFRFSAHPGLPPNHFLDGIPVIVNPPIPGWRIIKDPRQ